MMSDIVYFEVNNWFAGRDYPNDEPFVTWMRDDNLHDYFLNKEWVKKNKLVVAACNVEMSLNLCVAATKEWVEEKCPKLLSDEVTEAHFTICGPDGKKEKFETYSYKQFLRTPDEEGEVVGQFGCPFVPYSEENIGLHWFSEFYEGDDCQYKQIESSKGELYGD